MRFRLQILGYNKSSPPSYMRFIPRVVSLYNLGSPAKNLLVRSSLTWSRYSVVVTQCSLFIPFPWILSARSFVMTPSRSMASTQHASRSRANWMRRWFWSLLPANISPRVQAKMEATELVEVSRP
jgi:hypothetical protein